MLKEFRDFINRGNLIDIAVAFVIGVAFAGVVAALTDRIVGPLIGLIFNLSGLDRVGVFGRAVEGVKQGSLGAFLQAIINFLIVAFVMFLVVKAYNRFKTPIDETPGAPPEDIVLLREIRDSLQRS